MKDSALLWIAAIGAGLYFAYEQGWLSVITGCPPGMQAGGSGSVFGNSCVAGPAPASTSLISTGNYTGIPAAVIHTQPIANPLAPAPPQILSVPSQVSTDPGLPPANTVTPISNAPYACPMVGGFCIPPPVHLIAGVPV
jgi:hypothetical protein